MGRVHVHMTNTRITDPDSVERRYPCILRDFSIRQGFGGAGPQRGGGGCIRKIKFQLDVDASVFSERRTIAPYGMRGVDQNSVVGISGFVMTSRISSCRRIWGLNE